jgi:cytochrome d ubiquinol oxidase subunit II
MIDIATIWAFLICIALLAYVILDGFDLGVGVLFAREKDTRDRDTMMNTVAPVWDGNETWLVLGGGGLFAAFPLAYSILLTAFYAPVIAMLLCLVLRGVAFEFRWRTLRAKKYWDFAFIGGSTGAAFFQGVMIGAFVQGVKVSDRAYAGGWFDWLTPFTVLTGLALVAGYALLGACWLVIKTDGALQARMRARQVPIGIAAIVLLGAVSLATLFQNEAIRTRWLGDELRIALWIIPVLTAGLAAAFFASVRAKKELTPFLLSLALFGASFAGLAVSLYPNIIPPDISYREAANHSASLWFMLVGALALLPLIIGYTAYAYWIFRGKVTAGEGYH